MKKSTASALRRLLIADRAWRSAYQLCNHVLSLDKESINADLMFSLTTGIIGCYCGPFKEGQGVGKLPIGYQQFDCQGLCQNHRRMIQSRDKIYMHKDDLFENESLSDSKRYFIRISGNGDITGRLKNMKFGGYENIPQIIILIKHQMNRLRLEINNIISANFPTHNIGTTNCNYYAIQKTKPHLIQVSKNEYDLILTDIEQSQPPLPSRQKIRCKHKRRKIRCICCPSSTH